MKKFIADMERKAGSRFIPKKRYDCSDKKIAIIGAGPAGLSCAYYLALDNYDITVFEKEQRLGGMLTMGIPSFRLEKEVVDAEIEVLKALGVKFRTGVEVGKDVSLDELRAQGYQGFYLAIGAQGGRKIGVEGEDAQGVLTGIDFLRNVNLGKDAKLPGKVIVIGGGNIFRGLSGASKGFDRVKGDQMGMLATVINSLALSSALTTVGVKAKVLTAIRMEPVGEFYNKWRAIELLEQGNVVICSAGTGNPFFTTDTGSSLRGIEVEADVMLKGTRVDGIYTADPEKDPKAVKFDDITFDEIYNRGLKVMDLTATTMCKENNLPIIVFNMDKKGNLLKVINGEKIGTYVHN